MKKSLFLCMALILLSSCSPKREGSFFQRPEHGDRQLERAPRLERPFPLDRDKYFRCLLDVGDGEHTVLLELVRGEPETEADRESDVYPVEVNFYNLDDLSAPVQTERDSCMDHFQVTVEDMNFDGFLDFRYIYQYGANGGSLNYWLWDPAAERFVRLESEAISYFSSINFDPVEKVIFLHRHGSAVSGWDIYLRWIDGEPTPIRTLSYESADFAYQNCTVSDRIGGEMVQVWEGVIPLPDQDHWDDPVPEREAFGAWYDLDYHGE